MRSFLVAGAGALLATAAPAMAQEGDGFSGIYVGAAGGYDVQENDGGSRILFDRDLDGEFGDVVRTGTGANAFSPGFCNGRGVTSNAPGSTTPATPTQPAGLGCTNDEDGGAYYARVGIDRQIGSFVVGLVGEFGKTDINDSVTAFSTTPANYVMYREIDWEAGIRARAGYTPNNTTLFYGTAGPGYARIDRAFFTTNMANGFTERGDKNKFGIQAGGGVEQKLGDRFSVGLEYLYHQYRDDDFRVRAGSNGSTPAANPFISAPNTAGTDFKRTDELFKWYSFRAVAAFRF